MIDCGFNTIIASFYFTKIIFICKKKILHGFSLVVLVKPEKYMHSNIGINTIGKRTKFFRDEDPVLAKNNGSGAL